MSWPYSPITPGKVYQSYEVLRSVPRGVTERYFGAGFAFWAQEKEINPGKIPFVDAPRGSRYSIRQIQEELESLAVNVFINPANYTGAGDLETTNEPITGYDDEIQTWHWTLEELWAAAGMSPFGWTRIFNNHLGELVKDYGHPFDGDIMGSWIFNELWAVMTVLNKSVLRSVGGTGSPGCIGSWGFCTYDAYEGSGSSFEDTEILPSGPPIKTPGELYDEAVDDWETSGVYGPLEGGALGFSSDAFFGFYTASGGPQGINPLSSHVTGQGVTLTTSTEGKLRFSPDPECSFVEPDDEDTADTYSSTGFTMEGWFLGGKNLLEVDDSSATPPELGSGFQTWNDQGVGVDEDTWNLVHTWSDSDLVHWRDAATVGYMGPPPAPPERFVPETEARDAHYYPSEERFFTTAQALVFDWTFENG